MRWFARVLSAALVCGVLLPLQMVAPAAEAVKAPPWRWQTLSQVRTVEAGTEEDVVIYCPAGYRPVSMTWAPSSFYVRRLFETYNYSSNYGYLRLVANPSITVTVTVGLTCVHGDDLGTVSTVLVNVAHPTNEVSVGAYADCPAGTGPIAGSVTWDSFAAGRTVDISTPTEVGWYASGVYPYGQTATLKISVHCVSSSVLAGVHLVDGSVIVTTSPGSGIATAQCPAGERPVATGAFMYPLGGSVNPYAELGTTLEAVQTLPVNGAGSFTAAISAPNSNDNVVVARAWCAPYPRPEILMYVAPPSVQNHGDVTFSFTASDQAGSDLTIQCTRKGVPFNCLLEQSNVVAADEGSNAFQIKAENTSGGLAITTFWVTVDTTPPALTLGQHPDNLAGSSSASFAWSITDGTYTTVQCYVDDPPEQACTVPAVFDGLADGDHTFHWRATDAAGNESSGTYAWTIDTVDPVVTVGGAPPAFTQATSAAFTVDAVDSAPVEVFCRLDDAVEQPCPSPATYDALPDGDHVFAWRAVDAAGNESQGTVGWQVDTVAPSAALTAPSTAFTLATSASVAWTGGDVGGSGVAQWQVRRRTAPWNGSFGTWSAPATHGGSVHATPSGSLVRGTTYCWQVRAIDRAGNTSAWSAARCLAVPLDDRALTPTAGWTRITGSSYWLGTATRGTSLGATLTASGARLSRVALVATRCPTCGVVAIYVAGARVATVDLSAPTTRNRQLIAVPAFSYRTGAVTVKVMTSGELVKIDGLGITRG